MTAPFGVHAGWAAAGFCFGLSAVGFGALGQPHLLTWVMAVRDRKARLQGAAVARRSAVFPETLPVVHLRELQESCHPRVVPPEQGEPAAPESASRRWRVR